jgi:DNA ligase (NAD+)
MILPTNCPECKTRLRWTETKTDLFCPNTKCPGRHGKHIAAFFKNLLVDDVAQETVTGLITAGFDTIPKIVKNATPQKLMRLEGYQTTKAAKISKAVQNSLKEVPLSSVMHASGIFQDEMTSMGKTRLNDVVLHLGEGLIERGSPNDIRTKLTKLKGIGPKFIKLFVDNLPKWREFFSEIRNVYSPPSGPKTLKNVAACWTGFRDAEAERYLTQQGGQILSSVSKKCTVLFAASSTSGKVLKADKLGVEVISQEKMWTWLKERSK